LALENHVSPLLGPIRLLYGLVKVNEAECLAFGQTSQLRLEISLVCCNCT